jgi:glycerophosphoryl diester phosphodiesterase
MSFSQLATQRMRQLCPELPLVYLMEDAVPLRFRDGSLPKGVHIAGVDVDILRRWPHTVSRLRDHGNHVYVFTVDEAADVDLCLELGVDAIITNRPGFVLDHVGVTG